MVSERIQRQIDQLLDEAGYALSELDWDRVRMRCKGVLALDPENQDAVAYIQAADRAVSNDPTSNDQVQIQAESLRQQGRQLKLGTISLCLARVGE